MTTKPLNVMPTETVLRQTARRVRLPFGQYEVTVLVADDGQLIAIDEIRIRKDFLSPEQVLRSSRVVDVDRFYQE
jgi:hypothetical protein